MSSSVPQSTETPYGGKTRRIVLGLLSVVAVVASGVVAATPVAAKTRAATSTNGFAYTGINPCRVEDTRTDGKTLSAGGTLKVTVAGSSTCSAVPSSATAVVLNVTTTDTTASSYFTVFPTGQTQPTASNQNWTAGATIAARVTSGVGTSGQVSIFNFAGMADVVVDIDGYYGAAGSTGAGHYTPVSPFRAVDTRNTFQTIAPNSSISVQIAGAGIPSTGVQAAVLNVTVTNTQAPGFLTITPTGSTAATTSMLNWGAGQTIPNRNTALLGSNGQVTVFNGSSGSTDVVIDTDGWYGDSTQGFGTGSLFTPLSNPVRLLDTRSGGTLGTNSTSSLTVGGSNGIPSNATAVDQNVTVTNTTASSYLTVYPNSRPLASDNNWQAGWTIANSSTGGLNSAGAENFYNLIGSVDVVVDADGYFIPAPGVLVTANPSSLTAEGNQTPASDQSTITATVTDSSGHPIVNDNVNLTQSGSACGNATLQGTSPAAGPAASIVQTTNNNGQVSATWQEGSTTINSGTCTITATEANGGKSGTVNLTLTAAKNSVSVNSPSVAATGSATTTITATVCGFGGTGTSGGGNPCTSASKPGVVGDAVRVFPTGASASGSCGTLSPTTGATDASGNFKTTYTASTTAGTCNVQAQEANGGQTAAAPQTITQTAVPNNESLSANPSSLPADGTSKSTVSAVVTNAVTGAPVSGDQVNFTFSGDCGTNVATNKNTDSTGTASYTYTAASTPGFCSVTAQENAGTGTSKTVNITQTTGSGGSVTVTTSASSVKANGGGSGGTATITATVKTSNGTPVNGDSVLFTTSGGSSCGTFTTANPATTNASGQATVTYASSTTPGTCTVTATEGNQGLSGSTTETQTAVPNTVNFTTAPSAIQANGTSTETVAVTVCGYGGTGPTTGPCSASTPAVVGDTVNVTTAANPTGACGTLSKTTGTTDSNGNFSITYTSSTTPGFCTLTFTETATSGSTSGNVTQTTVPAQSANTIVNSPTTVTKNANGTDSVTITTTVTNGGAAVSGDEVNWTMTPSASGACGTLSSAYGVTNASGVTTVTYTTPAISGPAATSVTCTINATEANGNKTTPGGSNTVVTENEVPNSMTLSANPGSVSSSASGTSTLTATVTSGNGGAAVASDSVSFAVTASSDGTLAHCGAITGSPSTTNASGQATATYTAGGTPGIFCTITATEANTGKTATTTITQTT